MGSASTDHVPMHVHITCQYNHSLILITSVEVVIISTELKPVFETSYEK